MTDPDTPASPDTDGRRTEFQDKVRATFGDLVLHVIGLPRYQHQAIGDLQKLFLEPLLRNRILIARSEGTANRMIGFAVWASVSEETDKALRAQIEAGLFPPHMRPGDWTSGDIVWVLDVVAPDARTATAIVAGLRKEQDGAQIKLHPTVASQMDVGTPKDTDGAA